MLHPAKMTALRLLGYVALFSIALSPPVAGQTQQISHETLDMATIGALPEGPGKQGLIMDLNLMRLRPSVLDDTEVLNYFIRLNNCRNSEINVQMSSEFDLPQLQSFYKAKAPEILAETPKTLTFSVPIILGTYDTSRSAFPLRAAFSPKAGVLVDHFDVTGSSRVPPPSCRGIAIGGHSSSVFRSGFPEYEVAVKPWTLNWLPMEYVAAKAFVDRSLNYDLRQVQLIIDVEIVQQPPAVKPPPAMNLRLIAFRFEGIIKDAHVVAGDGATIATFTSFGPTPDVQVATSPPTAGSTPLGATAPPVQAQRSPIAPASPQTEAQGFPVLDTDGITSLSATYNAMVPAVLQLIRLDPAILDDVNILNYFIRMNNCQNPQINRSMINELDYPRVAAFYRARAAQIVAAIPSLFVERPIESLGPYNLQRAAFPLLPVFALDHIPAVVDGTENREATRVCPTILSQAPSIGGRRTSYQLTFRPIRITELPMSEEVARKFLDSLPHPGDRRMRFTVEVEIVPGAPQIDRSTFGEYTVSFSGRVKSIKVSDFFGTLNVATLNPYNDAGPSSESVQAVPFGGEAQKAAQPNSNVPRPSPNEPLSPAASTHKHSATSVQTFQDFSASCDAGDAKGCEMVGFNYRHGWGVDKDLQKAKEFYEKACSMGRQSSCRELRFIKVR